MKRLLLASVLAGAALCARAAAPAMEVHSIAQDFVSFWDATQTMPQAERIAAFKLQVASKFPAFYGVQRYDGKRTQAQQDYVIGNALDGFGKLRQHYVEKIASFDAELPRQVARFSSTFPDFRPQAELWFLHSLGEMDGGTRELDGRSYLIFGADLMAVLHGDQDESAFFQHELFHVHHDAVSPECDGQGMWQPLWREGLAVHVSKIISPQATEAEMLLDFPKGSLAITKAHLPQSLADLAPLLDQAGDQYYSQLFQDGAGPEGLAPRRGYYLGYLVAREIGATRDLPTLAKLNCADARKLVIDAVHTLQRRAAAAQ
jgi:hypothetical protein